MYGPEAGRFTLPSLRKNHQVNAFPAENAPPSVEVGVIL
jgi:hypothetical protein